MSILPFTYSSGHQNRNMAWKMASMNHTKMEKRLKKEAYQKRYGAKSFHSPTIFLLNPLKDGLLLLFKESCKQLVFFVSFFQFFILSLTLTLTTRYYYIESQLLIWKSSLNYSLKLHYMTPLLQKVFYSTNQIYNRIVW